MPLSIFKVLFFQYHTIDAIVAPLLPVGVSHRRHHALHPPYDAFIAPPGGRITWIDALVTLRVS